MKLKLNYLIKALLKCTVMYNKCIRKPDDFITIVFIHLLCYIYEIKYRKIRKFNVLEYS